MTIIVALAVTSACSDGESPSPGADGALLGPPFATVSDAASHGDFAVVFDVVAERDFGFADISRPADGSPPTSPPAYPDDDFVGRVVRVVVDTVVWDDGERVVPSEFEFVTAGWELRNGFRHAADDGGWYRVEVGRRYFGVFADVGGEMGPVSVNAIYVVEGDRLVEVSTAGGPEPFDGATLTEVAQLLDHAAEALEDVPLMDGNQLPPPSPERSPWARPAEDGPAVEFELRPAHDAEPAVSAAKRPWKLVGAAVIVAMVAVAGVLVAIRGNGSGDGEAAGTQQIQPPPSEGSSEDPATTNTAPVTAASATTAPPAPTTAAPKTVAETSAPPSTIGPIDVAPGTYSLEESQSQPPFPMRLTMSTDSLGETMAVYAEVDTSQRMHVTLDAGAGGDFEMVFDVAGGVGYLRGESFSPLQTTDAAWIAVNLEDMLSLSGMSYEEFRDSFSATPDYEALADIVVPTPLGLTEIDGESVMLYEYTLDGADLDAAADAAPAIADSFLFEGFGSSVGTTTYRLYVTEDNRLRRMEMDMGVDDETVETVMTFHPVELDFEVMVPDESVVERIDITQFAG